jgi:two-component system phosphate regulon sensor histidine kinase PhoR
MLRKPITIFYVLLIYALAELIWWGYLLVKMEPGRIGMILGEGSTFLVILIVGAIYFHRLLLKEKHIQAQQRNFLLSVTHELKSPLASIKLYLQTILKRDLDKEKREQFIQSSIDDIGRLDDLVENMLLASKIENRSYSFPKEEFDFSGLMNTMVNRLKINVQGKREVIAEIEEHIDYTGDRFSLGSMVNNLLENAVKYSEEQSRINIQLKKENEKIKLIVCDQGCGIADDDLEKIFQKFYRAGNEMTRKTKGTGLGLFIVQQVVQNHSATISIKNNLPKGTCFEITFN